MLSGVDQFIRLAQWPGVNSRTVVAKVTEQFIDHLRFLEQNLHIGICRVDLSEKRMVWSDGIYDLFDHDRSVRPSRDAFHQRMHPADRHDREVVNVALQRRISFDDKFRVILRDRRIRWMRACGEFLFNDSGHPDVLLAAYQDQVSGGACKALGADGYDHDTVDLDQEGHGGLAGCRSAFDRKRRLSVDVENRSGRSGANHATSSARA